MSSQEVLRKLGLYNDVVEGRLKCRVCAKTLTLDTIGAIITTGDKPVLICNKPTCMAILAALIPLGIVLTLQAQNT